VRTWRVSSEGREQVLSYLGPGRSFGVAAVLDGSGAPVGVDAAFPTTLFVLSASDFQQILREHQSVCLGVARDLAREVRRLTEMVEDLALHTVRARLARFLLTRVNEPGGPHRWTQEAIASYIGTVREMVARTLRVMAAQGLIRRERGRIVILDREGLEQEASMLEG
jgi:CRP/FNR family transcriptional regulator